MRLAFFSIGKASKVKPQIQGLTKLVKGVARALGSSRTIELNLLMVTFLTAVTH